MKKQLLSIPYYITIPAIIIISTMIGSIDNQIPESMSPWSFGLMVILGIVWQTCITISFWLNFPRRERHFNITLILFIMYGVLFNLPLTPNFVPPAMIFFLSIIQTIIGLSIVISLWIHNLRITAIFAMLFWILATMTSYIQVYNANLNTNRTFQQQYT